MTYRGGKIIRREEDEKKRTEDNAKYSLKIIHTDGSLEELADARTLTREQALNYLVQAKKGVLQGHTYIPVRKDTPQIIIDTVEQVNEKISNRSLVMQVQKAQQAMSIENRGGRNRASGSNIRAHALAPTEIVDIINQLDEPTTIIYQTNRQDQHGNNLPNNIAVFVDYSTGKNEGVAVIEFESSIDQNYIGNEFGDTSYHTVVTVFEPDLERQGIEFDYAEELLSNPDNIELEIQRRQPAGSATQEKHPNASSKLPSGNSITKPNEKVNSKSQFSRKSFSKQKEETQESAKKFSEIAVSTALYDALDHRDFGDDNLIRVSRMPRYVVENFGIDGEFYVYRDHIYENMVSRQQAEEDGRPTQRGGKNIHFHDLGIERMTDALLSLDEPIKLRSNDGNPTVVMMLPVEGDNGASLYAVLSFYSDKKINGRFEKKTRA